MNTLNDVIWDIETRNFFSCRWYLGQGTVFRNHNDVISCSNGGIEIWHMVNDGNRHRISAIYNTRRINRKLRQFKMEN